MAQKSAKRSPSRQRPEEIIAARPHPRPRPARKIVKKPRKSRVKKPGRRLRIAVARLGVKRVRPQLMVLVILVGSTVAWLMIIGMSKSMQLQNQMIERSGDGLAAVGQTHRELAALYGTDAQLLAEIEYAQAASKDLQTFAIQDYRQVKKQCMVNGEYFHKPIYIIQKVVKEKYAVVIRGCGGNQEALLFKSESGWAEIYTGNVPPSCSLVHDLDIPRGIRETCVHEGIEYTNPN